MENLFIWVEGYGSRFVKKAGLPCSINCILMEPSSPYSKSPNAPNDNGEWASYSYLNHCPITEKYRLPPELYLELSGNTRNVKFDFLARGDIKFVSQDFLKFLIDNTEPDTFDVSKITKIFNKKRIEIVTKKQYYAVRYFKYDDDLFDFHEEASKWFLYPNMKLKEGVDKKILALHEVDYRPALLFREDIKKEIERLGFLGPDIYTVDKYPYVFKGKPDK